MALATKDWSSLTFVWDVCSSQAASTTAVRHYLNLCAFAQSRFHSRVFGHDGVVPSSSCLSSRAPVAVAERARVRVRRVVTRACKPAEPSGCGSNRSSSRLQACTAISNALETHDFVAHMFAPSDIVSRMPRASWAWGFVE